MIQFQGWKKRVQREKKTITSLPFKALSHLLSERILAN